MSRRFLVAVAAAAALVASVLVAPAATADETPDDQTTAIQGEYEGLEPEEILEQGLAEEGLDLEAVEVGTDGVELEAAASEPTSDFSFSLELEPGQSFGQVTFTDRIDGELVTETYDISIQESTVEETSFTLTEPSSGETYNYDSANVNPSIAFVIPIAFAAISLGTALTYLAIGAAIIIGGVLALEAAKAVSKIIADNNRRSSSQKRDYYIAVRSGSKVYISPTGLTSAQAQARGRTGGDVWAISSTKAKSLAKLLNPSGNPVGAEKHGTGYLWHYHPYRHAPNMHSFYGSPS